MRQIYPEETALADADLAARYAYPELTGESAHWVRANMVASLDGAASLNGRSRGLSSDWDRQVFAMLRAIADVILVGAGTARTARSGRNPRGCAGPGCGRAARPRRRSRSSPGRLT